MYILAFLLISIPSEAQPYLESSDILKISSGSATAVVIGAVIKNKTDYTRQIIGGPLPLEKSLQKLLGGSYYNGKTNFLDSRLGSAITPISGSMILLTADLNYPSGDKTKTLFQDQFLYFSGLTATKGVTSIFKGLFNRQRPLLALYPEEAAKRKDVDMRYDRQSFFSGHTSSAFFSMSFVNSRLRSIMKTEMSLDEYRKWRWVSPAIMYGWAGFVGWSRIHSYKHFVSDVLVGAVAGYLISELFLSFGNDLYKMQAANSQNYLLKYTFKF